MGVKGQIWAYIKSTLGLSTAVRGIKSRAFQPIQKGRRPILGLSRRLEGPIWAYQGGLGAYPDESEVHLWAICAFLEGIWNHFGPIQGDHGHIYGHIQEVLRVTRLSRKPFLAHFEDFECTEIWGSRAHTVYLKIIVCICVFF